MHLGGKAALARLPSFCSERAVEIRVSPHDLAGQYSPAKSTRQLSLQAVLWQVTCDTWKGVTRVDLSSRSLVGMLD